MAQLRRLGFKPLPMAKPARNGRPERIASSAHTFFATTKTSRGVPSLQSERNAMLLIDVLRSYVAAGKFRIHDFVVMPNHLHVLLTVGRDMTIEKAMQLMKGSFSYRLKKESGYLGEVWQRGFSEVRIMDRESFSRHREYIANNPTKEGLAATSEEFRYCFAYLTKRKAAGAEAP
jgi:putative transposase